MIRNIILAAGLISLIACGTSNSTPSGVQPGGSNVNNGDSPNCTADQATEKARRITDQIAKENGLENSHASADPIKDDGTYFIVTTSYDTGLSVPTYSVKVRKTSCFIEGVSYGNREG